MGVIKKTVVIHPIMDSYIRKTWAIMIEKGRDASYSSALNLMLLIAIFEAMRGIDENTRKLIWDFLEDKETINDLNREDFLDKLELTLNQILLRK